MPYHIYIPWLREHFFATINNPKILEIGVDVGQSMLPIIQNFSFAHLPFEYVGLDIRQDENLTEILGHFMVSSNQKVRYEIKNSLAWLPECKEQFDIILIDGDHNYKTVYEELKHIGRLLKPNGVVICDDYQGSRWSKEDLYYSTRESHKDVKIATKAEKSDGKKGVRAAIDDFITENPKWKLENIIPVSEAIVIRRK